MKLFLEEIKGIIKYRKLIWKLAISQIRVKYRYPILGLFWLILMPISLALIFFFAFNIVMKVRIPHYPFFIYLLSALLPWGYFSNSIMQSTSSMIGSGTLIKNVAFCREIVPISFVLANLINFIFTLPVLFVFILIFKVKVSWFIVFLPLVMLIHSIVIIGISLMTSAFQVRLRDTTYIVEILITAVFYLTPIFYHLDLIKDISPSVLRIYMLNPLVGITTLYRITILGEFTAILPAEVNPFNLIVLPMILSLLILRIGLFVFKKYEPSFADLI